MRAWLQSGVMTMTEYISREAFLESQQHLYCDNCARRKNGKGKFVYEIGDAPCRACDIGDVLDSVEDFPAADVRPVPEGGIGEMSDGYHTFNGLYYQRMVLFAALVIAHNDKAWKSWRHEDGNLCFDGGWFIVGIDTPKGSYTYHYEDKYWNWFDCEELPVAKHWDGHTEKDVTRLLSLPAVRPEVRCRDCQNSYEWANVDGDNYRYCGYLRSRWNHDADRMVDDDDFCKWGRKREES